MTIILTPFHQVQRLADHDIPVRAEVIVAPRLPEADLWRRVAAVCEATAVAVAPVISSGHMPVVVSGDCLIAGGTLAGAQRAGQDPAIVWFDAHGDVHTLETSTSGYLGGLALRLLTGAHPELFATRFGLRPLPPERAVLVDARDLDPAESEYLEVSATQRISVAETGADTVPPGSLVLHVDVDVIDPRHLPGLRFPAPGGPSADSVVAACERLIATGRVVAVDLACPWWPADGNESHGIRAALLSRLCHLGSGVHQA